MDDTPDFDLSLYNYGYDDDESGAEEDEELPEIALQDLHKMLHVMLSGYKKIEQYGGIPRDKMHNGNWFIFDLFLLLYFAEWLGLRLTNYVATTDQKPKT